MIRVAAIAQSQQRAMTASLQAQALAVSHATTATRDTNDDTPEKRLTFLIVFMSKRMRVRPPAMKVATLIKEATQYGTHFHNASIQMVINNEKNEKKMHSSSKSMEAA